MEVIEHKVGDRVRSATTGIRATVCSARPLKVRTDNYGRVIEVGHPAEWVPLDAVTLLVEAMWIKPGRPARCKHTGRRCIVLRVLGEGAHYQVWWIDPEDSPFEMLMKLEATMNCIVSANMIEEVEDAASADADV